MKHNSIYRFIICIAASIVMLCTGAAAANLNVDDSQPEEINISAVRTQSSQVRKGSTLKILAIGNSFTQDTMRFVYDIAESAGCDVKVGVLWRGSKTLSNHLSYIKNDEKMYKYILYQKETALESPEDITVEQPVENPDEITEEPDDNSADGYVSASEVLQSEKWDLVFLQQASYDNGNKASFYDENGVSYITQLTQIIKSQVQNPELSFAWLMGWAYGKEYQSEKFAQYYGNDQITMYHAISDTLREVIWPTAQFDMIIPVGTAVQNIRTSYIGDNLNRDEGLHLSYSLGRYAAGLTVAKSIGIDLNKVTFLPDGSTRVSEYHLPMLKEAAEAAVKSPYAVMQSSYTDTRWLPTAKISSIKDSASGISVQWEEIKGAKTYYVYRKAEDEDGWELLGSTSYKAPLHTYKDQNTEHGIKYFYKIYTRFDSHLPTTKSVGKSMVHVDCAEITSVTPYKKGKITVKWDMQDGTTAYQIRYADNPLMKNAKIATSGEENKRAVISGLKSGKTYAVQIMSCVSLDKKIYRSQWSQVWLCTPQ